MGSTILPAFGSGKPAKYAFYEHHKDSIRFGYRCFDRILLNGLIQPFQQPERVVGFSVPIDTSIGKPGISCAGRLNSFSCG
jgi:hypothetical protein